MCRVLRRSERCATLGVAHGSTRSVAVCEIFLDSDVSLDLLDHWIIGCPVLEVLGPLSR